jgi:uncharacterized repeat protein (TIGR03803 family)
VDAGGNLYGAAEAAGGHGFGNIFKMTRRGDNWILTPLYNFEGGSDGSDPFAKVVVGPDGALYGTTTTGGGQGACECYGQNSGCGTVFKLTPPQTICHSTLCPWTETVLHRFGSGSDGKCPRSSLTFDRSGNIYGTTNYGGASGWGIVYELSRSANGWTETVIHDFNGSDGGAPRSEVTLDQFGNLYGTASQGGIGCQGTGCGLVYELSHNGTGWLETVLYEFGGSDGQGPSGGVIFDNAGNLYGTTQGDGIFSGSGTIFELSPFPGVWTRTPLYVWNSSTSDPEATLLTDSSGSLYGTTFEGGNNNLGSVFKLTKSSGNWRFDILHSFSGGDGVYLWDPVAMDASGNIYGTAWQAGQGCQPYGCGTVWRITPP